MIFNMTVAFQSLTLCFQVHGQQERRAGKRDHDEKQQYLVVALFQ